MPSKKKYYSQCRLEKRDGDAKIETVSYLPSQFAKKGRIVSLKESDGSWSDNWVVISFGPITDCPPDWRKLIKGHRKMTGDNLPKGKGK